MISDYEFAQLKKRVEELEKKAKIEETKFWPPRDWFCDGNCARCERTGCPVIIESPSWAPSTTEA